MGEINRGPPPRSRPKIGIGIFFWARSIEIIGIGDPGPPRLVGTKIKFFGIHRDNTRQVGIISKSPDFLDFSRLFFWSFVVPEKSRLFTQFSRSFGDQKSRLFSISRLIPTLTNFLFAKIEPPRLTIVFLDFSRNIPTFPEISRLTPT